MNQPPSTPRLLLGPGPSNVNPRVLEAMRRPLLGHLDPAFLELMDRVQERLRRLFRTDNAMTLPLSATGSAGMEACLANLLERGEEMVIGVAGVFGELQGKYLADTVKGPITWYFSLGDRADGKWTVGVAPGGVLDIQPGRPAGKADCVLKTDPKTFERIVREKYVPSFAEFADGRVKTNDPDLLRQFQSVFGL